MYTEIQDQLVFKHNMLFSYEELQCRHIIPALNVWADPAKYMTARPIVNQFPRHGYDNRTLTLL